MKNIYTILMIMLTTLTLGACTVKSTASKSSSALGTGTNGSNNSTTPTPTPSPSPTGGGVSCDGVYRDGATRCYYKNIPTIQVMGATTAATSSGSPYWSSVNLTASGTGISPNQFATDGTFNLRIIPRRAASTTAPSNPSVPGKTCSPFMNNATKLYVQIRLRQQSASTGELATLSSTIDTASNVWHFSPPVTAQPLILEVTNVLADIRCKQSGGVSYCPYADIPLNSPSATYPTECVAFDIQYSTDETYDVPGASAN